MLLDIATRGAPGYALVELAPPPAKGGEAPPAVPVPAPGPVLGPWEEVQRFYRDAALAAATGGAGAKGAAEQATQAEGAASPATAVAAPHAAAPAASDDADGEGESLGQAPPQLPLRFVDFCPLLFAQVSSKMGGEV